MTQLDEHGIIERIFKPLAGPGSLGLGDDAAFLTPPPGSDLVLTADMIVEGVHFLPDDPPDTIARKALRVNLSDLAAKGARPLGYLLSLGLSPRCDAGWLVPFGRALGEDNEAFGVALLGGDTVRAGERVCINVTALGAVPQGRMVRRGGARAGDRLYVSGEIGAATLGLALLTGGLAGADGWGEDARNELVARYRVPQPRLALRQALLDHASAAMDVSDGLVGDLDKLARESGVGAVLEAEHVPVPGIVREATDDLLTHCLTGGDDYEVLAAVPPDRSGAFEAATSATGVAVTRIGYCEPGGAVTVLRDGSPMRLTRRAYVHAPSEQDA